MTRRLVKTPAPKRPELDSAIARIRKSETLRPGDPIVMRLRDGYERPGVIVTVYDDLRGVPHCVVEHPHRIQHIYALTQVERPKT